MTSPLSLLAPSGFAGLIPSGLLAFALFEQCRAKPFEAGRGIVRHRQDASAVVGGERHVLTGRDRPEEDPGGVVGAVSGEHARELEHLLAIHLDAGDDRHLDESTAGASVHARDHRVAGISSSSHSSLTTTRSPTASRSAPPRGQGSRARHPRAGYDLPGA